MKLKITDIDSRSENESEYETAVDMSHSNIEDTDYYLETASGSVFKLACTQTHTTYSYYEEDIPDNYKPGDPISYSHQSSGDSKTSTYIRLEALADEKTIFLTKDEFIEYFKNYADKTEEEQDSYRYSNKMGNKFEEFSNQQKGYVNQDNVITIHLSKEFLNDFMQILEKQEKNTWFDVPEQLIGEMASIDEMNKKINKNNSDNFIDNMCVQANAKLSVLLDKLTHQAKMDIGLEVKPVKLKM